jgi:histidinol-phosphate/aromatic aminotransferase/cobyric acid decarboxylase-like protein
VDTPTRYAVEVRLPQAGCADVQEAAARARETTEQMRREGQQVRFLRSVFVPEDDACFLLYEGPSAESVRAAALRAKLGPRRVDAALVLEREETQ